MFTNEEDKWTYFRQYYYYFILEIPIQVLILMDKKKLFQSIQFLIYF